MAAQLRSVKFTYEDYLLFPNDGKRHELIDGEHYVTPSPNAKHQTVSVNLTVILSRFVRERRLGRIFSAPFDVVFSDLDVVQPDLLFVAAAHLNRVTEPNLQGPPDLAIEILSPGTRKTDETVKRKLYERYGVPEYWIVDPELETVKVYRLTEQGYVRAAELSREAGERLATPLLPDFSVPLADLFE
jgi:Uma2 family endonuclease